MHPAQKKITVAGWLYYHHRIRMDNWTAVRPQHNQIAPAYSEPIGLVTVDSTSSSFTSISRISISLCGWCTRPPIGSLPLDPTG